MICLLCSRPMLSSGAKTVEGRHHPMAATRHHLKPRSITNAGAWQVIWIHSHCHKRVHKFFSNEELYKDFSDPEVLKTEYLRREALNKEGKFKNYHYREYL